MNGGRYIAIHTLDIEPRLGGGGKRRQKKRKKVSDHVNYFGRRSSAIGSPDQFSTMAISNFNKSSGVGKIVQT